MFIWVAHESDVIQPRNNSQFPIMQVSAHHVHNIGNVYFVIADQWLHACAHTTVAFVDNFFRG